jgi:hypothetical protein
MVPNSVFCIELGKRNRHAPECGIIPKSGVNFALILRIWLKIDHLSTSCLQQLMDFGKRSLMTPVVSTCELGAVSSRSPEQGGAS